MRGWGSSGDCWFVMNIYSPSTTRSSILPVSGSRFGGIFETRSSTSCGPAQTDALGQFSIRVPLGEIEVYAEIQNAGYWRVVEASPSRRKEIQRVKLTRDAPTVTVNLDLGPRPGLLKFNVKDKATGKPIEAFTTRWIGMDEPMMWSLHGPATQTPSRSLSPSELELG